AELTDGFSTFAVIDWGDGTTSQGIIANGVTPNGAPDFTITAATPHTYLQQGTYQLTVGIASIDGQIAGTITGTVTVTDPNVLSATPTRPIVADPLTLTYNGTVATFTDAFTGTPVSDFTATITWGDGTTSVGALSEVNGIFTVAGTHAYAQPGVYTTSVTLAE